MRCKELTRNTNAIPVEFDNIWRFQLLGVNFDPISGGCVDVKFFSDQGSHFGNINKN